MTEKNYLETFKSALGRPISHYSLVCHSYIICMSLTCTHMSSVCRSYLLVCHPYVTRMYSYVIRMPLVCTRMSSACQSNVLVCHLYVTRMYSYVTLVYSYVTLMSIVSGFTMNPHTSRLDNILD